MGLMDILNGMQNGPRGQRQPTGSAPPESGGGVSPIMMALLGLLAYKAVKHIGGQPAAPGSQGRPHLWSVNRLWRSRSTHVRSFYWHRPGKNSQ